MALDDVKDSKISKGSWLFKGCLITVILIFLLVFGFSIIGFIFNAIGYQAE